MDIGKKIRTLRLAKGITQEKLAQELSVTPQAVSRWENGQSLPDIIMLPQISVCFGVRIDDLFELSDESKFERIENMTVKEGFLSRADFDDAERFYKERLALDAQEAKSLRGLADLYNHRADGYHRKAEMLAKRALEVEPEVKAGHSILSHAANGACRDWCCTNHRELIEYYYEFVEKNPGYARGYLWLLDNLLADGRLTEAMSVLPRMKAASDDFRVPLYEGQILAQMGERERAEAVWQKMVQEDAENWMAHSCLGDAYVKLERYEEAMKAYKRSAELESSPRYIDNWDSIGQICEMRGMWEEAAQAYERVLDIYREDWQSAEGFYVEQYRQKVLQCRAKGKRA